MQFPCAACILIAALVAASGEDQQCLVQARVHENGASKFSKGERLPICITGQIRRLELHSKIQHLVRPAVDHGHKVEVYLVLDPRPDTVFVHRAAGTDVGNYTIAEGSFSTLDETLQFFPPEVKVVLDPFVPEDYPVDPRYVEALKTTTHDVAGSEVEGAQKRAKSHMRQWEALARCWELLKAHGGSPKVAARIRDDLAVLEPFVPQYDALPRGIHLPNCDLYIGFNDKVAVLSGSETVKSYFTGPLFFMRRNTDAIFAQQKGRGDPPMNPESVLYNVVALSKMEHHFLDIPCYKATMLRDAQRQTHVCYVSDWRDHSCFSKILPGLKKHTESVSASIRADSSHTESFLCESLRAEGGLL